MEEKGRRLRGKDKRTGGSNVALRERDECLKEKEKEIAKLTEQNQERFHKINSLRRKNIAEIGCTGKKIGELSSKQRYRRIKDFKDRAQVALWFLKSYGLELTCLKGVDQKQRNTYTINFEHEDTQVPSTPAADDYNDQLEQVLHLLDKFCAIDKLYRELAIMRVQLPKSHLIKQKRSQLNNICTIENVPGHYPGAQIAFKETLRDYSISKTLSKVTRPLTLISLWKISADEVQMSRSTNFMKLSFSLLQTGEKVMSSRGN